MGIYFRFNWWGQLVYLFKKHKAKSGTYNYCTPNPLPIGLEKKMTGIKSTVMCYVEKIYMESDSCLDLSSLPQFFLKL